MWVVGLVTVRGGETCPGGGGEGGLINKETLYRVQQGDFQRERKDEERSKSEGGTGGRGRRMGETEEITVHEINILDAKGINKDSELGSVHGTQGMTTEWIFATTVAGFLGSRRILLPYS